MYRTSAENGKLTFKDISWKFQRSKIFLNAFRGYNSILEME